MRKRKICPVCNISTLYMSTHLRRAHRVASSSSLKQLSVSAEKDESFYKLHPTPPRFPGKTYGEASATLQDIAKWIHDLPITITEINQLRGRLWKEFQECVYHGSCTAEVKALLERIRCRMTQCINT